MDDPRPYDLAVEDAAYQRLERWQALTPAEREAEELAALLAVPAVARLVEERNDLRAERDILTAEYIAADAAAKHSAQLRLDAIAERDEARRQLAREQALAVGYQRQLGEARAC